jgi:hypothetical protein
MTFNASSIFRSYVTDVLNNTTALDLNSDAFKAALYSTTPDTATAKDDTSAHNAYNGAGGQFVTANELTSSPWVAGGVALASVTVTNPTSGVTMFDAADVAPGGTVTLSGVFGCLVYDTTVATPVANQGLCMNYFGGSQTVTSGTFTIVWSVNGILRITV